MGTMDCMLVEVHWLNIVLIVVMVIKFMMSLVVNMVRGNLVLGLIFMIFMRMTLALIEITSVGFVVLVTGHTGWTYIMVLIVLQVAFMEFFRHLILMMILLMGKVHSGVHEATRGFMSVIICLTVMI